MVKTSLNPLKRVNSILTEKGWFPAVRSNGTESQSPQAGQFNSYFSKTWS